MVDFEKMTDTEKECYEKVRYYYIESGAGEDDLSYLIDEVVKKHDKDANFYHSIPNDVFTFESSDKRITTFPYLKEHNCRAIYIADMLGKLGDVLYGKKTKNSNIFYEEAYNHISDKMEKEAKKIAVILNLGKTVEKQ